MPCCQPTRVRVPRVGPGPTPQSGPATQAHRSPAASTKNTISGGFALEPRVVDGGGRGDRSTVLVGDRVRHAASAVGSISRASCAGGRHVGRAERARRRRLPVPAAADACGGGAVERGPVTAGQPAGRRSRGRWPSRRGIGAGGAPAPARRCRPRRHWSRRCRRWSSAAKPAAGRVEPEAGERDHAGGDRHRREPSRASSACRAGRRRAGTVRPGRRVRPAAGPTGRRPARPPGRRSARGGGIGQGGVEPGGDVVGHRLGPPRRTPARSALTASSATASRRARRPTPGRRRPARRPRRRRGCRRARRRRSRRAGRGRPRCAFMTPPRLSSSAARSVASM